MGTIFLTLSLLLLFENVSSSPRDSSFVVLSEKIRTARMAYGNLPDVFEVDITSKVSHSFATTLMATKVRNRGTVPKETIFTVVLPDTGFISEFVMEVGTKRYRAFVKETEEAKNIYDTAVASGNTAAHIKARDSNRFTVSFNVEPNIKVRFLLTYEELLQRKNGQYELVLNIHPGKVVQYLNVEVTIKENRPIKFVRTPSIRSGNEITKNNRGLDPSADIKWLNSTMVTVTFNPTSEKQRQLAHHLKKKESDGISGQFVVQYDVERNSSGGEIFLQDGYFVHFFAPNNLKLLPKHVLFVLDTSGSMYGKKISQLKTAMTSILRQIKMGDKVSIIEFSTRVKVWDISSKRVNIISNINYYQPFSSLRGKRLPVPREFNRYLLMKAKQVIYQMRATGGTNIIAALETALYMVKIDQESGQDSGRKYQPIIIFLTDGEANGGINSGDKIVDIVTRLNSESHNTPIISLSFGKRADKDFLKKLSSRNNGFWKHIYEASDASLQLEYFYKEISSPVLSDIDFDYISDVKEVTIKEFPIYFQGGELVVAGKYEDLYFAPTVTAVGAGGPTTLTPVILGKPITQLERLWAYLTVKQILDKRNYADNREELTRKAVTLAQKYSFVTDVTSLVVVKPTITSVVDIDNASEDGIPVFFGSRASFGTATTGDETAETDSETEAPSLQDVLPWLASVLQANETINVGQNVYQLGSNYSSDTELGCTKTPYNDAESGICVLLKDCPDVYSNLTSLQVYQNYFCAVDSKYAGICCPKEELED